MERELKNTQEVLAKAKLYPKLKLGERLKGGGVKILEPKTVELVDDKIIKKIDPKDLKEKYYMRYNVKHNGELRRYETLLQSETGDPSYLVQRMGAFKPGDVVTMQLAKAGQQTYVEVTSDLDDPTEEGREVPHHEEVDNEEPPD